MCKSIPIRRQRQDETGEVQAAGKWYKVRTNRTKRKWYLRRSDLWAELFGWPILKPRLILSRLFSNCWEDWGK